MRTFLGLPLLLYFRAALTLTSNSGSLEPRYFAARPDCNNKIPDALVPGDPRRRTYNHKIKKAFADADHLARQVSANRDAFRRSTAYSHYFTPEDYDRVIAMYNSLTWIMSTKALQIPYSCGSSQNPDCTDDTYAITDAIRNVGMIAFCDRFFRDYGPDLDPDVVFDLDSAPAYDDRHQDLRWCHEGEGYGYFVVAGATVLHEMTHLDVVGNRAQLPLEPVGLENSSIGHTHATDDIDRVGTVEDRVRYLGEPWEDARNLKKYWDAYNAHSESKHPPYRPLLQCFRNAESYAAAAVEFHFLQLCGWSEILPHESQSSNIFSLHSGAASLMTNN